MNIKIELKSDAIFGSGASVPGGEHISLLVDRDGFPFLRGTTLKGVLRETAANYLGWTEQNDPEQVMKRLFGTSTAAIDADEEGKLLISNFYLSKGVRSTLLDEAALYEAKYDHRNLLAEAFSYLRTFTAINDEGVAEDGSLRIARCLKRGLIFYGSIQCIKDDEKLLIELLSYIKWMGTMRTRGMGRVEITCL